LAMALLHGWTGSFASGWVMHLVFIAITFFLYLRLDPARYADAMAADRTVEPRAAEPART
ncbi:hypothetical protein AB4144_61265, partial [Rhizobiaceae sp. 2RAB30]